MSQPFRKSMTWLHTYSGLLLGWLLFAIWVTGTLSYFNSEISLWMKPELGYSQHSKDLVNESLGLLHEQGTAANRWRIYLPDSRNKHWSIDWRDKNNSKSVTLNPENAEPIQLRDTQGGNFFRAFHYTLSLRGYGGRYYAGIAALAFLVAIFSGIFTHRRFFKDFFTLRTGKFVKTLRDFHALAGVITIPFNIMICVSAMMIYVIMYMPWSAEQYYERGERGLYQDIIPSLPNLSDDVASTVPIVDFNDIQQQVDQQWPGGQQIASITIEQPYQENGRVIVYRVKDSSLTSQSQRLVFSSVSGDSLDGYASQSNAAKLRRLLWGLHEAKFATPILRWLSFFLGVISCALIATGLIYWLKIRISKNRDENHFGHYLVERLNIAGINGLLMAVASYFLANRVLPFDVVDRESLEVQIFFWAWLATFVHAFLRPPYHAWQEQLRMAGIIFVSVPVIDLMQESQRTVIAIQQSNAAYLSISLALFLSGLLLFVTARWLKIKSPSKIGQQSIDRSETAL